MQTDVMHRRDRGNRWRALGAVWVGLGAVALLLTPVAAALTRSQADRIALRALHSTRLRGPVVLFGLPAKLAAGTDVVEAGPGPSTMAHTQFKREGFDLVAVTTVHQRPLAHSTWLFWEDLEPYALFEHPSVLLLIDDRTGKVVRRQAESWFPLINGVAPAFLTPSGYSSARYRVFADEPRLAPHRGARGHRAVASSRRTAPAAGAQPPVSAASPLATAAVSGPPDLHTACMVTIGDRIEPLFTGDFKLLGQIASELRLPKYEALDGNDLDAKVTAAINAGCKDVLIVIAAHGYPGIGSNYPHPAGGMIPELEHAGVQLQYKTGKDAAGNDVVTTTNLDAVAVRGIMAKHPQIGFKLLVMSCFSGRWTELSDVPNLRYLAASSRSDQESFGYFPAVAPSGVHYEWNKGTQTNAVVTKTNTKLKNNTTNTTQASEFMNGLLRGLDFWAHSDSERAATGNDLAKALVVAFQHEGANDFASQLGWTVPVVGDYSNRMPEIEPKHEPTPISPQQAAAIIFGAELLEEPDVIEEATEDYVMWLIEEYFGGASPLLQPLAGSGIRAHAASGTTSGAVPANGKVTQVKVRGYYAGGCPVTESVCQENMHFQDLRPLSGSELEVHSTTQAFTLPTTPGTYTFEPTEFYVQKGDYIGLATVGGKFKVLVSVPGAQTAVFVGHAKDMNGDHISATRTQPGAEVNMQVTLQPSG